MPQFGRKTRRNKNRWPGRRALRWDIGMVGEGCWTVPAYQDPSFLQTAGDKTLSEPHGIGITSIHPARRSHPGQSHLGGEQDPQFQQAFLRGSLLPITSWSGGARGSGRC